MEPSLAPHLVHMPVRVVPFSWYVSSPILYLKCNIDQVANELVWQMAEERGCWCG